MFQNLRKLFWDCCCCCRSCNPFELENHIIIVDLKSYWDHFQLMLKKEKRN
jgi:hypothetical protein